MADIVDLRGQHAPLSHRTCEARAYFLDGPDRAIVDSAIVDWAIVDRAIVDWVESTVSRLSRAARVFHRHVQSSRLTVDSTVAIGWSAAIGWSVA
ncbi:hypothetical protein, partial [Stenotrophomonas maltophilia]|uniref:hypothetical protein n=1 Tax=Stenotrophomonas maltophilia TaxID=40324 RepID=UPI001952C56B